MDGTTSADTRLWSQLNFAEYGYGEDPFDGNAAPETTLDEDIADPATVTDFDVADGSVLGSSGALLVSYGSEYWVFLYTLVSGNNVSGVSLVNSSGSSTPLTGQRVQQYLTDSLDPLVHRSWSEFLSKTGCDLTAVDDAFVPLAQECLQLLTEWRAVAGQQEVVETGADFDLIGSFSAGTYSETRRADNRRRLVLHPVPRIAELLLFFMTPEQRAALGFEAPEVTELESPADWESARNIMSPSRPWDLAFGPVVPPWYGWTW